MRDAVLAVVAVAGAVLLWLLLPGQPLELEEPAATVAEARRLITEQRADTTRHRDGIPAASAPPALRIRGLNYVRVHGDHVDLVTNRSPDGPWGYRIWAATGARAHADRPTDYADVFRFSFTDDDAVSPTNIP